MAKLKQAIWHWYQGEAYVPPDDPNSGVVFFSIRFKRHWTAQIARVLAEFYLANWQWVIGTFIAVMSLWVAVLTLR